MRSPKFSHRKRRPSHRSAVVVSTASGTEIGSSALAKLEELDDVVFAALGGDADALDQLQPLWGSVRGNVAAPFVAESKAVYRRQAKQVFDDSLRLPERSLGRGFAALEVLGLVDC